jgi:nitrogen fixation protein FixH
MARELTGRKTLAICLVSFGVVFAVNGYMVAQALSTFRGDDENDAYLQGVDYNQTLDRREKQAALGWHAAIGAERQHSDALRIVVSVLDPAGRPVQGLKVSGVLRHPADANRDRALALREQRAGVYVTSLEHVAAGSWSVIVHTQTHNQPFEATRQVWLR